MVSVSVLFDGSVGVVLISNPQGPKLETLFLQSESQESKKESVVL